MYLDIVFIQQAGQAIQAKLSFFYPVHFGIDGEIMGSPEIGFLNDGVFK
jgi:hypothetical protein